MGAVARYFSMGHLFSKVSEKVEKEDLNPNYQTYGREGDAVYAVDRNGEYQPSDYDYMEETSGDNKQETIRGNNIPFKKKEKKTKLKKYCLLVAAILGIAIIALGLVGIVFFVTPTSSNQNITDEIEIEVS